MRLVMRYGRGAEQKRYLKKLLEPLILDIIAQPALDLSVDPTVVSDLSHIVYDCLLMEQFRSIVRVFRTRRTILGARLSDLCMSICALLSLTTLLEVSALAVRASSISRIRPVQSLLRRFTQ